MKYGCGVVTYFPTNTQIDDIIKKKELFDMLLVFDNTPYDSLIKANEIEKNFSEKKIVYIHNGKNRGLSVAYNIMCKMAMENDCDYLSILDQDSAFFSGEIKKMFSFIDKFEVAEKVGVFAPTIVYKHSDNKTEIKSDGYELVKWAISSGSFLNLEVFKKTTGFDEFLFIDRVDYDYCKMISEMQYYIIKVSDVFLLQELGETRYRFGKSISEHSSLRIYYMSRNRWYISNKHERFPKKWIVPLLATIRQYFMIIVYERDKVNKINCLNRGIKDFFSYKKGSGKL